VEHEALRRLVEAMSPLVRLLEAGHAPRQIRSIGKVRTAEIMDAYRDARNELLLEQLRRAG
jgi:hypothetical protein